MEAGLSPLEGNVGKSDTDFKETEGPANLHHGPAGLRGPFASVSEVGEKPRPAAQRAPGKRSASGLSWRRRRCGYSQFFCTNAGRQRAFGHRGEEKRGKVATVATGTISTNEEALLDIQHRERWPKFLKPAVELERRSLGAAFS